MQAQTPLDVPAEPEWIAQAELHHEAAVALKRDPNNGEAWLRAFDFAIATGHMAKGAARYASSNADLFADEEDAPTPPETTRHHDAMINELGKALRANARSTDYSEPALRGGMPLTRAS
jgi:hypothetical protein